jgi:hypothetical protein
VYSEVEILEVVGSNPTPATKKKTRGAVMLPFNFSKPISSGLVA